MLMVPLLLLISFAMPLWAQEKDWEKEWNGLIAAAKKEGKVVVRGYPDPEARRQIPAAFEARFGVSVEYITGRSSQLVARLLMERRAGLYSVDVIMGGLSTLANPLYSEKMLTPIRPLLIFPEVVDPSKWKKGKLWFMDPEDQYIPRLLSYRTGVLYINTRYVKPGEIKLMKDLLNPKWKGKISTGDPRTSGSGSLGPIILYLEFGEEFVKKLYFDQKAVISRSSRILADWLVQGKYPISLSTSDNDVERLRREGLPVMKIYSLPDFRGRVTGAAGLLGFVKPAPHPNAARLFINWLASREGLEILSRATLIPTTRNDVDESFLPTRMIPRPDVDYFDAYDWEFRTIKFREAIQRMKEILKNR